MNQQPKKFRILLKPLMPDSELRREIYLARRANKYPGHPYYRQDLGDLETRAAASIQGMQPRVLDVDAFKVVDDGSAIVGIGPTKRTTTMRCLTSSNHAKALKIRTENPEFYHLAHTNTGVDPNDPSHTDYILTRFFEKILSLNLDNIISVNGKPVMGSLRGLDRATGHLDLDESDWSVDSISELLDE